MPVIEPVVIPVIEPVEMPVKPEPVEGIISYISKIENNLKETKFGTIRRYVEALKVSKMSLNLEFDNGKSETLQLI